MKFFDINRENVLFFLFGLPTWILVDGTWSALSQIANELPEGYNISSYLMLSLTIGNICPLILGRYLRTSSMNVLIKIIYIILSLGSISGFLIAFLWSYSIEINNQLISLPLYMLFFIIGSCSLSSNITHYIFVSNFESSNTTMLSVGMASGSMIAGLLALIQGLLLVNQGFSVQLYYMILFTIYIPGLLSFYILSNGIINRLNHIKHFNTSININENDDLVETTYHLDSTYTISSFKYNENEFIIKYYYIFIIQLVISIFGYGIVPSIISYTCSKYRNRNIILLLSTSLGSIIDPWGRLLTNYYTIDNINYFFINMFILISLGLGLIILTMLPADSYMYKGGISDSLPIIFYILFMTMFGFTNTSIFKYFKTNILGNCSHSYRWSGISMQSGAMIGSFLTFILIITQEIV